MDHPVIFDRVCVLWKLSKFHYIHTYESVDIVIYGYFMCQQSAIEFIFRH